MTEVIRRTAVFLLFLGLFWGVTGCNKEQDRPPFDVNSIKSYQEIPGVTGEEITAIEALKQKRQSFSFGVMLSTESFIMPDGTYAGFTALLCDMLSGLFGIPFIQESHSWESLISRMDSSLIDFSGELTPSAARKQVYFMTHPIAERSLGVFT